MILYALFDKKSDLLEYFLASCDEDAVRVASVMMLNSRHYFEFADDFAVLRIEELPSTRSLINPYDRDQIVVDCSELRRQIIERRKEQENAEG